MLYQMFHYILYGFCLFGFSVVFTEIRVGKDFTAAPAFNNSFVIVPELEAKFTLQSVYRIHTRIVTSCQPHRINLEGTSTVNGQCTFQTLLLSSANPKAD